jgi:hypothetical protein
VSASVLRSQASTIIWDALATSNRGKLCRYRPFRAGHCARDGGTSKACPTRSATREMADPESNRPSGRLVASAWVQTRGLLRRRSTGPWGAFLPWSTFLNGQSLKSPNEYLIHPPRQALRKKCRPTAEAAGRRRAAVRPGAGVASRRLHACQAERKLLLAPISRRAFDARQWLHVLSCKREGRIQSAERAVPTHINQI